MDRYREWHRIDLVKLIVNRNAIDPLAIIYLAHFDQFGKSVSGGKIWGMSDEQSSAILGTLTVIPSAIIKVYTSLHDSVCEDIGFAKILNVDAMKYHNFGIKTGLFSCSIPEPRGGMYPEVCYYASHVCSVSFEFVKRSATYAFMSMRLLTCRDVAGLIARRVARMYMEDYEWLRTVLLTESSLRERILKWVPIDEAKLLNDW